MKRLFVLQAVVGVVLLFLVAVYAARLLEENSHARVQLGGKGSIHLAPDTVRFLRGLDGRLTLTWFGSRRSAMPPHMKGIEDAVRDRLDAFAAAAPQHIDCRLIDPTVDVEQGAAYASRKGASPFKVRRVLQDEASEVAVWSSLVIASDRHPDTLIQAITPADLPWLDELIEQNIEAAANPIQPVVAIAAPARGYSRAADLLRNDLLQQTPGAKVIAIDFDHDANIPPEVDALFWIDPGAGSRAHALALDRFLRSGRSAVIAGSTYGVDYLARDGNRTTYRLVPSPCDWQGLLRPFGLSLAPLLVRDQRHEPINRRRSDDRAIPVDAPFHLRVLPSNIDTKSLLGPNSGMLVIAAMSPIRIDLAAVAATGRRANIVATTSEQARVIELPAGEFDDAALEGARAVPKQPWFVHLQANDAWQGDLLLASTTGLFEDDVLAQSNHADALFLRTVLRSVVQPARLVRLRVPRIAPELVPAQPLAARLGWRAFTAFALPVAFLLVALRRARRSRRSPTVAAWRHTLVFGVAFALTVVATLSMPRTGASALDLTEARSNTPSPLSVKLLASVKQDLEVQLLISEGLHMPAAYKQLERRVVAELHSLGLVPRIRRPEELTEAQRTELRQRDITPFDVDSVVDDAPVTAPVWSALEMTRHGRTEVVPRIDMRSVEHLEFLIAAAVKRLSGSKMPVVGILSDLPRLSPAEAHGDYQQKGYTAPIGADVYSVAKRVLAEHGYATRYIDPEKPVLPEGMDVLVWLQPRFPRRVYPQFAAFMASGGKALVASQHYNVQQRQYPGSGFETVYWPQPQYTEFNDYLELIGVRQIGEKRGEQAGEILFDRQHASLSLDTQVNRSVFREHDPQQVARPFLIRAAGEGLAADSVITNRLGSLLFVWGSRFMLDPQRLGSAGLVSTVLVTTSPRTWTYAWSGRWIPVEAFTEPATGLLGPQPLAVLLEGRFPGVEITKDAQQRDVLHAQEPPDHSPPGMLLLIGCSEMFKNEHILAADHQHEQFLLNAVAALAHGPELAEIQARTHVAPGVAFRTEGEKLLWRAVVMASAPLLFVLYALLRRRLRRRLLVTC